MLYRQNGDYSLLSKRAMVLLCKTKQLIYRVDMPVLLKPHLVGIYYVLQFCKLCYLAKIRASTHYWIHVFCVCCGHSQIFLLRAKSCD